MESDEAYLRPDQAIEPAMFEPLVLRMGTALTARTVGRAVANLGYAEFTVGKIRASRSWPTQAIAEV